MIAQLGERQTEDLKVPGSIPGHGRGYHVLFFCLGEARGVPEDCGNNMK